MAKNEDDDFVVLPCPGAPRVTPEELNKKNADFWAAHKAEVRPIIENSPSLLDPAKGDLFAWPPAKAMMQTVEEARAEREKAASLLGREGVDEEVKAWVSTLQRAKASKPRVKKPLTVLIEAILDEDPKITERDMYHRIRGTPGVSEDSHPEDGEKYVLHYQGDSVTASRLKSRLYDVRQGRHKELD